MPTFVPAYCKSDFGTEMGLFGFDSRLNGCVSMPSTVAMLVNLGYKLLIGENSYALAA